MEEAENVRNQISLRWPSLAGIKVGTNMELTPHTRHLRLYIPTRTAVKSMLPSSSPSHAPTPSKPAVAGKLPQSASRGERTNQRRHLSSDFPADHHQLRPPHGVRLVALPPAIISDQVLTPSTPAVTGKS